MYVLTNYAGIWFPAELRVSSFEQMLEMPDILAISVLHDRKAHEWTCITWRTNGRRSVNYFPAEERDFFRRWSHPLFEVDQMGGDWLLTRVR